MGWRHGSWGRPCLAQLTCWLILGSIKQLHERVAQECAEYRALYEQMVLPADVGPRVDWARVLEQKQVRGTPCLGHPWRTQNCILAQSESKTEWHLSWAWPWTWGQLRV